MPCLRTSARTRGRCGQSAGWPCAYWVDLDRIGFGDGGIARTIDAYDHSLSGDITGRLLGKTS